MAGVISPRMKAEDSSPPGNEKQGRMQGKKGNNKQTPNKNSFKNVKRGRVSSSEEEDDADSEANDEDDDDDETDEDANDDDAQPAVIAPSARAVRRSGRQAGRKNPEEQDVESDEDDTSMSEVELTQKKRSSRTSKKIQTHRHQSEENTNDLDVDDDDYGALDAISDSDEGGRNLEHEESKFIVDEIKAQNNIQTGRSAHTAAVGDTSAIYEPFDITDHFIPQDASFFDEEYERFDDGFETTSAFGLDGANEIKKPLPEKAKSRRVRFQSPREKEEEKRSKRRGVSRSPTHEERDNMMMLIDQEIVDLCDDDEGSTGGNSSGYECGLPAACRLLLLLTRLIS